MIDDKPIVVALNRNLGSPTAPGEATEAELARERYGIEMPAEEEISRLLATLSELEQLDRRQCQELRAGGAEHPTQPFGWTLEAWLLTRLAGWVSENPRHQGFVEKDLAELDALAQPGGEE